MAYEEHPNTKDLDWRLQAVTTLAEPAKLQFEHASGAPVTLAAIIEFQKDTFVFNLPNVSALFLDFAYTLWSEAEEALADDLFIPSSSSPTLRPKNDEILYRTIEKRMGAIVFAYSALEAFANESIPDDYIFERERPDKKYVEKYTKQQIENTLSLDVKLTEILPVRFGIKNPKGTKVWNKYVLWKELRDRIIHFKTADRRSVGPKDDTMWRQLLKRTHANPSIEVKEIISYYGTNARWLRRFPYPQAT